MSGETKQSKVQETNKKIPPKKLKKTSSEIQDKSGEILLVIFFK